ncbi:MAG: hypothetical protein JSS12_10375 [Verrucomicrobia bacterium]|nr:hypothetical protein [Verrucomicrobiota bacterium]
MRSLIDHSSEQEIQSEYEKIDKLLLEVMNVLSAVLLDYEKEYLISLISHNEGGIAFQDMISAIKFHKVMLSNSDFKKIEEVGELIGHCTQSEK